MTRLKMKSNLKLCLVTLALFFVVTPGEIQELDLKCSKDDSLTVRYDFMNGNVLCGEEVPLGLFRGLPPYIKYQKAEKGERYLLIMADPDAPSPQNPLQRYWLHWMVTAVKGEDLKQGIESQDWGSNSIGRTLISYNPPTPPQGTHRYQFFLYKLQPGQDMTLNSDSRGKFDLQAFAAGLKDPVAFTEFKTGKPRE